jgi:crotonobetainyl-CoA:carnitine CoA-transferase CaiB-like acyl-CoA transferase
MSTLQGITVVSLALNLPGPLAAQQLAQLGAKVIKVEPPSGDPMEHYCPDWYKTLVSGQEVLRLNLKYPIERNTLAELLQKADLLITSSRPAALARLKLSWPDLKLHFPRLCQVAIVGYAPPQEERAGHDLTYQAALGLIDPPHLPRSLFVDLLGAERAIRSALGLLLTRERSGQNGYAQVALAEAAATMADPLRFNLTDPGGLLGGRTPEYNIYQTKDGWVAIAALEPRFKKRFDDFVGYDLETKEQYSEEFKMKTAAEWQQIGDALDIPITKIQTA